MTVPHPNHSFPALNNDHTDTHEDELDAADVEEVIHDDQNADHPMNSDVDSNSEVGEESMELELVNDSKAYFDNHTASLFTVAGHPTDHNIFLTGGEDDTAYIWTSAPSSSADATVTPRACTAIRKLESHRDSVAATAFTNPAGEYAITAGLDGRVQIFAAPNWRRTDTAQEVEEAVWLATHQTDPLFALGATDGSVWLYDIVDGQLVTRHVFYSHTASTTAGIFTPPSGAFLCSSSEDGSFYAWDVATGQTVVALTTADQRFAVDGGLFSLAVSSSGTIAAVGGANGEIRVIGLPPDTSSSATSIPSNRGRPGRSQAGGGGSLGGDHAGQVIASMNTHTESVESLDFHQTAPVLISGSVDGKIGIYDTTRGYALRKMLETPHSGDAVVKAECVATDQDGWVFTSCGIDGTVKRWDARTGAELCCLRGHLGGNRTEGEGGVLEFVQMRTKIVTAGDDGLALVYEDVPTR